MAPEGSTPNPHLSSLRRSGTFRTNQALAPALGLVSRVTPVQTAKDRPVERLGFQPQQLRGIGLGHLHNVRLGDALCDQSFVERQQSISMERIVGLTQVG